MNETGSDDRDYCDDLEATNRGRHTPCPPSVGNNDRIRRRHEAHRERPAQSILTRFLLKDFHELFAEHGYVVGKIYPDHVDIRDYDLGDEDFLGPNYLACRAEEPALRLVGLSAP